MKKRLLAILTIAAMTLSFTACGDSDKKTTEEKTTTESSANDQDIQNSDELDDTEITSEETTEETATATVATRATIENDVFTNETFKVSFPITDNMRLLSDEEIADLLGLTKDTLVENGNYTAEQFEAATGGSIYDAYIYLDELGSNVSVAYINLGASGISYTAEQYAEITCQQLSAMTSPRYTLDPVSTASYGGQTYTVISASTDIGANQKLLLRKEGSYMVVITLTVIEGQNNLETEFLNSFTEVQ